MAIDKTGYHELAWHGSYKRRGSDLDQREPVTLELRPCSLFSYLKEVKN